MQMCLRIILSNLKLVFVLGVIGLGLDGTVMDLCLVGLSLAVAFIALLTSLEFVLTITTTKLSNTGVRDMQQIKAVLTYS